MLADEARAGSELADISSPAGSTEPEEEADSPSLLACDEDFGTSLLAPSWPLIEGWSAIHKYKYLKI